MVGMGMGDENGSKRFVLQGSQIWEGISTAIQTDPCIDDDPLPCQFHGQATGTNATGTSNKEYLHF